MPKHFGHFTVYRHLKIKFTVNISYKERTPRTNEILVYM